MRHVRTLLIVGALAAPALLTGGCAADAPAGPSALADRAATLRIDGLTCASCSVTVRVAARRLDGVADVDVNVRAGTARITYDGERVTAEQIARAVSDAGHEAAVLTDEGV